jgi:hypothetical protein
MGRCRCRRSWLYRWPYGEPQAWWAEPSAVTHYRACKSIDDQKRSSELHGEAHKIARDELPQELLNRLAAAAEGRYDLRVGPPEKSAALGWPPSHASGPPTHHRRAGAPVRQFDGVQLLDAVLSGYERGRGSLWADDPSDSTRRLWPMTDWARTARLHKHATRDTRCCRCDESIRAGEPVVIPGLRSSGQAHPRGCWSRRQSDPYGPGRLPF